MGIPLTPDQILSALREAGLNVYETPGWRDRCRCHNGSHERGESPSGRAWGPFNGITLHITAGPLLTGQQAVDYCQGILTQGRSDVPGPLCMAGIDGDGRIILVSSGRANHIGSISAASLSAMVAASFSLEGSQNLRGHGTDGNTHTVGFEILQPGTPTDVQRNAAIRAAAAIAKAAGWAGQEIHGHGECSDQRGFSDPGLDMGAVRREAMALIGSSGGSGAGGGVPSGVVTPPPAPPARPQVSVSRTAAAFRHDSQPSVPTGAVSYQPVIWVEKALAAKGLLDPRWVDGSGGSRTVQAYAALQRSYGYSGRDADGIPGTASMTRLAHETGLFDAIA